MITVTPDQPNTEALTVGEVGDQLNARLRQLHDQLLESFPVVDRIACVLYEQQEDLLKTFVNSTREGVAISGYEFRLSDSRSLSNLAEQGKSRVLDDIPAAVHGNSLHSVWLLKEGYRSSLTVPLFDHHHFIGFIFYDSREPGAFTPEVQRNLSLYSKLINMTISSELNVVRSITASAQVAREFANLRDFETGSHLERMAHYARLIAKDLATSHHLSDEFIEHLFLFAPLHDIGKIGIPDSVLLKAGRLDPEERQIMETHVQKGIDVLDRLIGEFGLNELPDSAMMVNVVASHHECLDGSGYPKGLMRDQIPLEARIIAVADIFDALTTHRPYKEPWTVEAAIGELERLVQLGKIDADCVSALKRHPEEVNAIRLRYPDS
jgi:HD-GYP domain-containing protein (c-di-GMP phosphodiesterase class II)